MNAHNPAELKTVIEHFYHWEKSEPDRPFLRQPVGEQWQVLSFAQAGEQARRIATHLRKTGLKVGDHVGIYSKNCQHWILADLAIMMGGFVSVPFYASLPKDQLAEVIGLADLKALFIGRLEEWGDKAEVIDEQLQIVRFPHYHGDPQVHVGQQWDSLIEANQPLNEVIVPAPDDLWTIKFTSGTTGKPKGVMLTHNAPALLMQNERECARLGLFETPNLSFFSFLPLNHVGERLGIEVSAMTIGGQISFAENLDSFPANIRDTQPSLLFAVPRIWTVFYQGVTAKIPEKRLNTLLKIPLVSALLRKKLRKAMGLSNLKIALTGAAITPAFIKEFYAKLGIHLVEAYGMTEVCGSIVSGIDPQDPRDSVGKVIPFAEVKIDPTNQEILMKSPYMMKGYYKEPEKTAEVLQQGWLRSGDKGTMTEDGYLYVTGRVNDAFKTAKGSYVTPNPLEEVIAANQFVEQVCVVGLGIPQPIALINTSVAAQDCSKAEVEQSILKTIQELNKTRAKFERISTAVVQSEAWSPSNGLLTPTLKVRRGEIDEQYSRDYLDWHEHGDVVLWR